MGRSPVFNYWKYLSVEALKELQVSVCRTALSRRQWTGSNV